MIGEAVARKAAPGASHGRLRLGVLAIVFGIAAAVSAAEAAPSLPNRAAVAPAAAAMPIDARCGHGWHWVPPHYAKHAKWRAGHCSRN